MIHRIIYWTLGRTGKGLVKFLPWVIHVTFDLFVPQESVTEAAGDQDETSITMAPVNR